MNFYSIILAAGKGKRMRDEAAPDEFPKVLRKACGRPLISYVIDALQASGTKDITIIVGFGADHVRQTLGPDYNYVTQVEQLGSGHAVLFAREDLGRRKGDLVVMCGDSPLFTEATVTALKEHHEASGAMITLVSTTLDEPTGYGRIKRLSSGEIAGVVEEKCASDEEKTIKEINGGAYAFDSKWLWDNIYSMERNEAGEWNLTDMVRIAVEQGAKIEAISTSPEQVMGVNTPDDLRQVEEILCRREKSPE